MKTIRVLSLFSGGRGFDMGSKMAGGTTCFLNDWSDAALQAYINHLPVNRPIEDHMTSEGYFHHGDVREINRHVIAALLAEHTGTEFAEKFLAPFFIDYALSGSSCQDTTSLNRFRAYWKSRNKLMLHQVKVLAEEVRPKVIVMEQVPGLLDTEMQEFLRELKLIMRTHGKEYEWRMEKLDASRYGSHQKRLRLIFIGVHKEFGIIPSFPEPGPVNENSYLDKLLPGVTHIFDKNGVAHWTKDKLPPTLTRGDIWLLENGEKRPMTVEEKLRISHIEGYDLTGIKKADQHILIGNMVQVKFAEALCAHIIKEILPRCA